MEFIDNIQAKADYLSKAADVVTGTSGFTETVNVASTKEQGVMSKSTVAGDGVFYLIKVALTIYLIQQIVPSSEQYKNVRIALYVLAVIGSGYPLFFLIILYLMRMKITM